MNYSQIDKCNIANGPGIRVAVWVCGCENYCPECFNPELWAFDYGKYFSAGTMAEIIKALKPDYIKGLTILGGEPLHGRNAGEVARLVELVRSEYGDRKDIWLYTGFKMRSDAFKPDKINCDNNFVSMIDVVVDGPFMIDKRVIDLQYRGSTNQRIIDVKKSIETGALELWENPDPEYAEMAVTPGMGTEITGGGVDRKGCCD